LNKKENGLITRRQAVVSIGAFAAGVLLKPSSVFATPVKDQIRFAVIGDWGNGSNRESNIAGQMLAAHRAKALDFVLTAGDNIYPDGRSRNFATNFEIPFSGLINEKVNFYAVLGNHDVEDGRQDQCQYPLFNMSGQNYYSLKQGDGLAEIFMLDSTDMGIGQLAWFERSLRNSNARWKLVVLHHPLYSSGKSHGSSIILRKVLEPLLTRYRVNAVFSGHDHIYERTKPQRDIQYFVTGAGGKVRKGDVNLKSEFREASYDEGGHFMLVKISDDQITFQTINETGAMVDSGNIK
jgi:3',5'-cyclic AMP phosphodiesterase CpdA